ncbi:hypothetical protein AB0L88_26825 [Saccharopolyspora shandongensis]|uniref:Uncharacterized protein n=1 Tax=Saccharopolyspora shandongensis TaxID=418495 RepID=A0A1H2QF45_9PSEU|nr:hypothetical protein [Saccharopolyspora shandongensis]SDW05530.1 hypothetical protein SAMN05216215_100180 [Saccharopolyspora shandongensis]
MDGVVNNSLDAWRTGTIGPRLVQIADRPWVRDEMRGLRDARSRRTAVNLALLRAPLNGVDLDSDDHAMLTWLADRDADIVAGVHSLLDRARAAPPVPGAAEAGHE